MNKEEKQLLLVDLCARLPYGVNVQVKEWTTLDTELKIGHIQRLQNDDIELKPYLRPMYSMTEEEVKEYKAFHCVACEHTHFYPQFCTVANELNMFDWLNKKMFDYRGLISKGLAIEAPEGMYNN